MLGKNSEVEQKKTVEKIELTTKNPEKNNQKEMFWTTVLVGLTGLGLVASMGYSLFVFNKKIDNLNTHVKALNNDVEQLKITGGGAAETHLPDEDEKPKIIYGNTNIADGAVKGNKDTATVAIVEYSDYECPFCKRHVTQTLPQILQEYVNTGKVIYVYRNNPLGFHEPNASQQAMGAECAGEQGKYWEMHDLIFSTTQSNKSNLNETLFKTLPAQISGLDQAKWNECYNSQKYAQKIKDDIKAAQDAGMEGTPGFIVGKWDKQTGKVDGVVIAGAYPFVAPAGAKNLPIDFKTAIEKYLQ